MKRFIFLTGFLLIILSSSTFRLKKKYEYITDFKLDSYFIEFVNRESFELRLYSCCYRIKVVGNYKATKDTVFLNYCDFYDLDDQTEWIRIDTLISEYKEEKIDLINGQLSICKKFQKLIRKDNDNILVPYGMKRYTPLKAK